MGQLIPEKKILQGNIQDYLKQSALDYSKLMQGAPTFVTYYSKNRAASTEDIGLETVQEVVGAESPLQYDKIEDFVLYGIDALSIQNEVSEFGPDTSVEGTATVLPNTIKPLPDDFFIIDYSGEKRMFRVSASNPDKIKGGVFYRIDFFLVSDDPALLEEQVEEEYAVIYNSLGTDEKAVLKREAVLKMVTLDALYNALVDFFVKNYLNRKFNVISHKVNDMNVYNDYVVKFVRDNDLLNKGRSYLSSTYIVDIFGESGWFDEEYEGSLYYALQYGTNETLQYENFGASRIINEDAPFWSSYEKFYKSVYTDASPLFMPHDGKLVENVKSNTLYTKEDADGNRVEDSSYGLENLVIKFANGALSFDDALIEKLNKMNYFPDLRTFLLIPCILFALKTFRSKLVQ